MANTYAQYAKKKWGGARPVGNVGEAFYAALEKSGARLCKDCEQYVYPDSHDCPVRHMVEVAASL